MDGERKDGESDKEEEGGWRMTERARKGRTEVIKRGPRLD